MHWVELKNQRASESSNQRLKTGTEEWQQTGWDISHLLHILKLSAQLDWWLYIRITSCIEHSWVGSIHPYACFSPALRASTEPKTLVMFTNWSRRCVLANEVSARHSCVKGSRILRVKLNYFLTSILDFYCWFTKLSVAQWHRTALFKLWSADNKWSSGSALVVLLDWTLVQKRQKKSN
jgi:hypothetical protein